MTERIVPLVLLLLMLCAPVRGQATYEPREGWKGEKSSAKEEDPDFKTDRSEYRRALAVYQSGNIREARRLCDHIIETYKTGPWVQRAMLLKARAYFRSNDLKRSEKTLALLRERFPGTALTREISDLRIAIARTYVDRGKHTGVKILEDMVENNPYGPRADEAQYLIGQYYLKKRRHLDAAQAFALVVVQYKDSRYREDAMFLRAKASYLDNKGPRRDPLPYEEARAGLKDYLASYPNGKRAAEATRLLKEIEDTLARKQYLVAEYYRKQRRYRAAQRYYLAVLKEHPDSTWAAKARERLRKVAKKVKPQAKPAPVPAKEPTPKKDETTDEEETEEALPEGEDVETK